MKKWEKHQVTQVVILGNEIFNPTISDNIKSISSKLHHLIKDGPINVQHSLR